MIGNNSTAISAQNVTVHIGDARVLDGVSFEVGSGSFVGVVGPNEAGKSTLFNAIVGLIHINEGTILIHGKSPKQVRGALAYVPQKESVNWRIPLTPWDVVMLGRTRHIGWLRRPSNLDRETVKTCLERVGMLERRTSLMTELSGGQRQRVFVARALAQEADIMLLDEAFSGVDVASQEGLVGILRSLRDEGKTILIATHDLTNLARRFDLILCINRHVCAYGAPEEVFTQEVLEELYGSHGVVFANEGGAR